MEIQILIIFIRNMYLLKIKRNIGDMLLHLTEKNTMVNVLMLGEPEREKIRKKQSNYYKTKWLTLIINHGLKVFLEYSGYTQDRVNRALQEMIVSTCVQHGPKGMAGVCRRAQLSPNMEPAEIIQRIYKSRGMVDITFASSSDSIKRAAANRFKREVGEVMAFLDEDELAEMPKTDEELNNALEQNPEEIAKDIKEQKQIDSFENPTPTNVGFTDREGKYPKQVRDGDPPVHRLAVGNKQDTCISYREEHLEKGNKLPKGTWDEPKPQYNTKYPDNYVISTSGRCYNGTWFVRRPEKLLE